MAGLGPNQKKILLVLLAGVALTVNASPQGGRYIARAFAKDWKNINKQSLGRSMKTLEQEKYILFKKKKNIFFPILTARGRRQAFFTELAAMEVRTDEAWDGKWRVVLFDVPEDYRKIRNFLRNQLRRMGFLELQKSVFVHAYACEKQVLKISNYFGNGEYIRFIEANRIDNETELKKHFCLSY